MAVIARSLPGVPSVGDVTEFGKSPFFAASDCAAIGYRMMIEPVSSIALRR
jgi:methylisocitrate lyase